MRASDGQPGNRPHADDPGTADTALASALAFCRAHGYAITGKSDAVRRGQAIVAIAHWLRNGGTAHRGKLARGPRQKGETAR